jgi:ferritin-like metal-binding protein YciE
MLGFEEAVELLTDSLEEEADTDDRLTQLAMSGINEAAID